jgi:hypothetical protein
MRPRPSKEETEKKRKKRKKEKEEGSTTNARPTFIFSGGSWTPLGLTFKI